MLPLPHQVAFLLFAVVTLAFGARAFYRLSQIIRQGRPDPEPRLDHLPQRLVRALRLTLTQSRTFKKRPLVSLFHAFIFYGFVVYLHVNLIDALEGFFPLQITYTPYLFAADILSFLVLLGVVALVTRRFLLPARRDFRFNPRTLLHPAVRRNRITRDSLIVSAFILFHVGSRAIGAAARIAQTGPSPAEPFATLLAHAIPPAHAEALRILGFWGALGSVFAFLPYFPYTKHIHIFLASLKYTVARRQPTGVMPPLDITGEDPTTLGANMLQDLAWPRLLDAYACIQCNRCQDVCPASATGKSLSPAALEINKRMELNTSNSLSPQQLLAFALSPEAAWACTTCGACLEVCPTNDEQMLDILDIRRHQVMVEGDFPAPLQTAFRGMERAQNPWGINRAKRLDWADGLRVPTTDEKPTPEVLYWVGCAASYDPSAQKTARAVVQLFDHAQVDFAVLGKRECCTGDAARRAGNEVLYRQLADESVSTLNTLAPKLIVASCPHCMNAIANEYKQIGGNYQVLHHTQYLETLVNAGKITPKPTDTPTTYHDPCYLGRHNGIYDAPRNLLHVLSNDVRELPRNRENAFCCGAGGAQFWKEEEPGDERIAANRLHEAKQTLVSPAATTLAVGCPFCKSMLASTPADGHQPNIKDIAELLLESILPPQIPEPSPPISTYALSPTSSLPAPSPIQTAAEPLPIDMKPPNRPKWQPKQPAQAVIAIPEPTPEAPPPPTPDTPRKKWIPKSSPSN